MRIVNDQLLQEKIHFKPHPGQEKILNNLRRFTTIVAGRRFGKTMVSAYIALKELVGVNKNIWIVSPTYDLSMKVFDYLRQWIGVAFPKDFKIITAPHPKIISATGSVLEGKSAENENSLMGSELDLAILDEAAAMSSKIWDVYILSLIHI